MNLCVNTSNITILCAYLNGCLKIKILPHFNDENILDFIQNVLKIIFFYGLEWKTTSGSFWN